jgi:hypothetical protein
MLREQSPAGADNPRVIGTPQRGLRRQGRKNRAMKAIKIALAVGMSIVATGALADTHDLVTGFDSRGECQKSLTFSNWDFKHEAELNGDDTGLANEYLHGRYSCQQFHGKWYIVPAY